jgi:protein TonB
MHEPPWKRLPQQRFAIALIVSALLHSALSGSVTQGISSRKLSALPTPSAVHVRLVPHEPESRETAQRNAEPSAHALTGIAPARRTVDSALSVQTDSAPVESDMGLEASDPNYYTARQLDVYPALATALDFRLSGSGAGDARGRVLVLVDIDASGTVVAVNVVEAEPAGSFEDDARRAFQSAQFRPALKNGRPVKSRILVQLDYGNAVAASP